MIVVDTNVIAYFLIQSERTALAENVLRKDSEWAAPLLWRSELRNVLLLYIRKNELDLVGAIEKMNGAERMIGGKDYVVEPRLVLELSGRSGCTAYDCDFVSLAEMLDIPLVTSDKKLLAAFPDIAISMDAFTA